MDIVHKSSADGTHAEPDGDGWEIPPRAHPLAGHVRRDLEDDVGDEEGREDLVVVVTFHVEVLLKTGEPRVTYTARV